MGNLQKRAQDFAAALDWNDPLLTSTDGKATYTLQNVYDMLQKSEGRIAAAARQLGVGLNYFGRVVQGVPALLEVVELHRELFIDEAEAAVRASVQAGDAIIAMQVLKTAGKKRGWTEKEGVSLNEGRVEVTYVNDWRPAVTQEEILDIELEEDGAAEEPESGPIRPAPSSDPVSTEEEEGFSIS